MNEPSLGGKSASGASADPTSPSLMVARREFVGRSAQMSVGLAAALGLPGQGADGLVRPAAQLADNAYLPAPPLTFDVLPPPEQRPATEGFAPLPLAGGARLWYWDTGGDGEPVLLVHAGTGSALVWEYQQPVFAAAGYRVVAYSRRGHARSDPGPLDERSAAQGGTALDDLLALAGHLGLGRFHLLGTAAGGGIANAFAIAHPERVRTLITACSVQNITDADWRARMAAIRPTTFAANPADFRELGPSYRAAAPEGVTRWNELEQVSRPTTVTQQSGVEVTWAGLAALPMPVLIVGGDADLYVPPALLRWVHARVPGSELAIIPEAGHSAYWERPDLFNRVVLDFLGRNQG